MIVSETKHKNQAVRKTLLFTIKIYKMAFMLSFWVNKYG